MFANSSFSLFLHYFHALLIYFVSILSIACYSSSRLPKNEMEIEIKGEANAELIDSDIEHSSKNGIEAMIKFYFFINILTTAVQVIPERSVGFHSNNITGMTSIFNLIRSFIISDDTGNQNQNKLIPESKKMKIVIFMALRNIVESRFFSGIDYRELNRVGRSLLVECSCSSIDIMRTRCQHIDQESVKYNTFVGYIITDCLKAVSEISISTGTSVSARTSAGVSTGALEQKLSGNNGTVKNGTQNSYANNVNNLNNTINVYSKNNEAIKNNVSIGSSEYDKNKGKKTLELQYKKHVEAKKSPGKDLVSEFEINGEGGVYNARSRRVNEMYVRWAFLIDKVNEIGRAHV